MIVPIIDFGHGGIINGEYTTAPSKMFTFDDGLTVYEGVINRKIGKYLSEMLTSVEHEILVPEDEDISLNKRRQRLNTLYQKHNGNCFLVSIHCNAGGGTGIEIFTTRGNTKSDYIAEVLMKHASNEIDMKFRKDYSDGDSDKEANFTILMSAMPSVLTENGFMDRREDAEYILSDIGQYQLALYHYKGILEILNSFNHINEIPS